MPHIQIDDLVFKAAERRAAEGGYATVDEYISDVVTHDLGEESERFDVLFTHERLADLKRISVEMQNGGTRHTMAELMAHFDNKRKTWLANRPA